MEAAGGSGRPGPPAVRSNGRNGNRSRLPRCAVAPEVDGARGAARPRGCPSFASFRGFSRTAGLRVADGIKEVSPVNGRVQESRARRRAVLWGGETARTSSTALAETARASPATRRGAARTSSTEVFETARVVPATDHDPRRRREGCSETARPSSTEVFETARTSSTEVFETARVTPAMNDANAETPTNWEERRGFHAFSANPTWA